MANGSETFTPNQAEYDAWASTLDRAKQSTGMTKENMADIEMITRNVAADLEKMAALPIIDPAIVDLMEDMQEKVKAAGVNVEKLVKLRKEEVKVINAEIEASKDVKLSTLDHARIILTKKIANPFIIDALWDAYTEFMGSTQEVYADLKKKLKDQKSSK